MTTMENQESQKPKYPQSIQTALQRMASENRRKRITTNIFDDLCDAETYTYHARFWLVCANELLNNQGRKFVLDNHNKPIIRGLLYYFNQCPLAETEECLQYHDADGNLERNPDGSTNPMFRLGRNIMLTGGVGAGKTLIMDTFALYLKRTNNPMAFRNISVTEMLNYYKKNGNLDVYTYNVGERSFDGNPVAYCLNDVGLQTQKFYGNDLQLMVDEYFHARNEIWTQYGVRSHVTTNLTKRELEAVFKDEYGRLNDRWKTYNIIFLDGDSRR